MTEVQLDLRLLRCPRCAGDLVVRIQADETSESLRLVVDSACASCGVSPWDDSDQRTMLFRPGAPIGAGLGATVAGAADDYVAELSQAGTRIDGLLHRVNELERDLDQARRSVGRASSDERRRKQDLEQELRQEISRLEGALAEARREVRRAEEATRGAVSPGLRAIELD
jgi:outer membrane murein-binding lipoprotein Lpp